MGVKTKEGSFIRIHDNVIINGEIRLIRANRDNHVVTERHSLVNSPSPEGEAAGATGIIASKVSLGLTETFPASLRDVSTK